MRPRVNLSLHASCRCRKCGRCEAKDKTTAIIASFTNTAELDIYTKTFLSKNVKDKAASVLSLLFTESALFFRPAGLLLPLQLDLVGLCSVVHERFLEPRVLQSLLGRDSLLGVIHKDAS